MRGNLRNYLLDIVVSNLDVVVSIAFKRQFARRVIEK
jgi:hypothetical protein